MYTRTKKKQTPTTNLTIPPSIKQAKAPIMLQAKKKKKQKKTKCKKKAPKPNLATPIDKNIIHKTIDKNITSKTSVPKKKQKKIISIWSYIVPFNRRPREKTQQHHHKKESVWASKCKNCILASSVHDIVNSQFTKNTSKLMPVSQLRVMLSSGGRNLIPDQEWMRFMEEEAIRKYKSVKSDCKHKVQVKDYEVVSHPENPWLVGLCMWAIDRHTKERWPLLVKCLYKYPDSTIRHASKHRSFCVRWNEVNYTLRSDHAYYTQIQCLLAITDKIYAELLVHTHKETTVVPVYYDADFWEETAIRLETFFTHNVLPYFKNNGMEQGDSIVKPPASNLSYTRDETLLQKCCSLDRGEISMASCKLCAVLDGHEKEIEDLQTLPKEKQEDAENRARRGNLRIRGLPESITDLQGTITAFFQELAPDIPVECLKFDHIHRELFSLTPFSNPRDVIIKFHFYCTKVRLSQAAYAKSELLFGNHRLQLFNDIAPSTIAKRKKLKPYLQILQSHGVQYRWGFPFKLLFSVQSQQFQVSTTSDLRKCFQELGFELP